MFTWPGAVKRLVFLSVLAFVPASALAQTSTHPAPMQWDVAGSVGLFSGYTPRPGIFAYQETWFHSPHAAVTVGRYLGRHAKIEFEGSTTGGGTMFREHLTTVPGYAFPYPIGSQVTTAVHAVAAALTWQFLDNQWVHPFVQAGVSGDIERVTVRTWEQDFIGQPSRSLPPERIRVSEDALVKTTNSHVRALVGGGAKVYVTPRAFVRTDARWTFDRERHNLAVRIGVGTDF